MSPTIAYAPGRVELLGNHTDYNDGCVLSAAIDRGVKIEAETRDDRKIALDSTTMQRATGLDLDDLRASEAEEWANYAAGVLKCFLVEGHELGGGSASISSDLPLGAGLSSSAALEVATATLVTKLFGISMEKLALAKLCRRAENEFVGVNCGLLDQVSSVFGREHHAIFLDCREETVETIAIAFPADVTLVITQSGVKHSLTGGEYNERRAQCFEAAEKLGVRALRDASIEHLEAGRQSMSDLAFRRALHVVGENERVLRGIDFLRARNVGDFGEFMFVSHESSRLNFENSTPELDALVEAARTLDGVFGSRLTGGGFGGATVSLVHRDAAESAAEDLKRQFRDRTGHECQTYLCEIAEGAH